MVNQVVESTDIEDIAAGSFMQSAIEAMAQQATASFGQANQIFMAPHVMKSIMGIGGWSHSPEFAGTSWEDQYRMTKRERKFAQLHVFIYKLGVLPGGQINNDIHEIAVKRLKRAKWARYQKPKKV
jgi:GH18 family chitinase